jgi:hypothetical protein
MKSGRRNGSSLQFEGKGNIKPYAIMSSIVLSLDAFTILMKVKEVLLGG